MKALLARIREKRAAAPQVQADFQEEKNVKMLNKPITSSGKIWFQSLARTITNACKVSSLLISKRRRGNFDELFGSSSQIQQGPL